MNISKILNLMPAAVRDSFRRHYLGQRLDQIALNRAYVQELIAERQAELRKLDADEVLVRHELGCL